MQEQTLMELIEDFSIQSPEEPFKKIDENLERAIELEQLGFTKLSESLMSDINFKDKLNRLNETKLIKINNDSIKAFLKRKAEKYNEKRRQEDSNNLKDLQPSFITCIGDTVFITGNINKDSPFFTILPKELQSTNTNLNAAQTNEPPRGFEYNMTGVDIATVRNGLIERFPNIIHKTKIQTDKQNEEEYIQDTCDRNTFKEGTIGKFVYREIPLSKYISMPPKEVLSVIKDFIKKNLFDYFTIASVEGIHDPLLFGRIYNSDIRWFLYQWGEDISLDDVL